MIFQERTVHLIDTDATGFLYFTSQQVFVVELIEELFPMRELIFKRCYALPIVEAYSVYKKSLTVGDKVRISLQISEIKEKSFKWHSIIYDQKDQIAGEVELTHVAIDRETREAIPLPLEVIDVLTRLFPSLQM
jgi:acyl-CoA thioesterase FadM